MQSEPPAAGQDGEDKHVLGPEADGALSIVSLRKKDLSCLERI